MTSSNPNSSSQWAVLKRILAFSVPYRGRLATALALTLVSAGIALLLPLGIKMLLDDALTEGNRTLLHNLGLGLFVLFLINAVTSYVATVVLQTAGERMVVDLRQKLYRHYQSLDLNFFHGHRIGDLVSRLDNDTDSIQQTISSLVSSAAVNGFKMIGAVALMVALDVRLSLLVLVMAPAATLLSRFFGKILRQMARLLHERQADATSVAQETLSSIQLVQTYARGEHENARYERSLEAYFEGAKKEVHAHSLFVSLVGLMSVLSTIAIFWYGGSQVLQGQLQVGDVVAFLFYSQMVTQSIGVLAELSGGISRMIGSSERVFELLDTTPLVANAADARPATDVEGRLDLQDVTFGYPGREPVLREVSFSVEPGQTVALVGPSGAGKSSLLRLLPRLFDPTEGRILLDGQDLRELELESVRSKLAVVSQEVQLFATTVRENIRYGRLDATDEEVEAAARAARVADFIDDLPEGYDTMVGERGVNLSGGQRQRISIARALLRDAPILILDEATSSVDSESEAKIQDALDRLRSNRTTLIAAHRLSTILEADKILVLEDGRVVEFGSHSELIYRNGLYSRLVEQHFRGHGHGESRLRAVEADDSRQEAVA